MVRLTRRAALGLVGSGVALSAFGTVVSAQSAVATVVDIPSEDRVPENLAVADDGTLYFGITAGEVWKLTPEQTGETGLTLDDAERVATLPGNVAGVEVAPDGTLYVASAAETGTGAWRIPPGGDPEFFAAVPPGDAETDAERVFPNDLRYDGARERLLVTESLGGAVYEVPLDATDPATAASVWLDAAPLDTESFGANGLTFGPDGDAVFVAVTRATDDAGDDVGRLVRAPVESDGSAGDAETYLESAAVYGADGITSRGRCVYVAANARNEVVRVTPRKRTEVVASGDDGLVFPSDVAFGTVPSQRGSLFVSNFANENPTEGAILRIDG